MTSLINSGLPRADKRDRTYQGIRYRDIGFVFCQDQARVAEGICIECGAHRFCAIGALGGDNCKNLSWNEVKDWARDHMKVCQFRYKWDAWLERVAAANG